MRRLRYLSETNAATDTVRLSVLSFAYLSEGFLFRLCNKPGKGYPNGLELLLAITKFCSIYSTPSGNWIGFSTIGLLRSPAAIRQSRERTTFRHYTVLCGDYINVGTHLFHADLFATSQENVKTCSNARFTLELKSSTPVGILYISNFCFSCLQIHSVTKNDKSLVYSEVQILVNATDNEAVYKCEAINPAIDIPMFQAVKFNVYCTYTNKRVLLYSLMYPHFSTKCTLPASALFVELVCFSSSGQRDYQERPARVASRNGGKVDMRRQFE